MTPETRAVAEKPLFEDVVEQQMLESERRITQEMEEMEDDKPSGSQEVKAEWDDEAEVDKDHGILIDSGEGDATKGEKPVNIPRCVVGMRENW